MHGGVTEHTQPTSGPDILVCPAHQVQMQIFNVKGREGACSV